MAKKPAKPAAKKAAFKPKGKTVNPKDFGAVGDASTDDSAAFQAAIEAAKRSDEDVSNEERQLRKHNFGF